MSEKNQFICRIENMASRWIVWQKQLPLQLIMEDAKFTLKIRFAFINLQRG